MSYGAGVVFGVGLVVSGMTRPAKVIAFLDPLGDWDPSLAFVMLGAIAVHHLAYRLLPRLRGPPWATRWGIPTRRDLDARLLAGAVLFGAGWGLAGYCPGPALTAIPSGNGPTLLFVAAMLAGMGAYTFREAFVARGGAGSRRSDVPAEQGGER